MLDEVARQARPVTLAGERLLPVLPALRAVLPDGLRRGSVIAVTGSTSLALALVAAASSAGSWCAAVGVGSPPVSPVAAAELGVALGRFPLVAAAPGSGRGGWTWAVAALLNAVDVVVAWPPPHLRPADARRLAARGRERGSVLVIARTEAQRRPAATRGIARTEAQRRPAATRGTARTEAWADVVDVRLTVTAMTWEGVGDGHGRLLARRMEVVATGRGAAARERGAALWLPAAGGGVAAASGAGATTSGTGGPVRGEARGA